MHRWFSWVYACVLLATVSPQAWSGLITLDPVYSGTVEHNVRSYFLPPEYPPVPSVTSYRNDAPLEALLQYEWASAGCLCGEFAEMNGYLIYDLSALTFSAFEATLNLNLDLSDFHDPKKLMAYPVEDFTPEFIRSLPTGGVGGLPISLGQALFNDLQDGPALGSIDISSGSGLFDIELNSIALDLINNAGGLLALGLYHEQGAVWYDEMIFSNPPGLTLRAVPVPASVWLLLAGLLALRRLPRLHSS